MKKLFITLIILIPCVAFSQKDLKEGPVEIKEETIEFIDTDAEFPGGPLEMKKFIVKNTKYPLIARDSNISGKVYVAFSISRDGSITDVEVIKSVHPLLDAEAMRVIKSMPKWVPAHQQGRPVIASFILPVSFKLLR